MRDKVNLKTVLKTLWILYAIFSIFLVIYLIDRLVCKDIMKVSSRYELNDNWNFTIKDKYYENVSLEGFSFDTVDKGEKIAMEMTVPTDYEYREAALCMKVRHATVSLYVDGKLEYEYGQERMKANKTTGSGYLLINFYEEYRGKELRLELTSTEDNGFSKVDPMWLCEWENSYRYIITNNRLPMLMGSFLLVFGVVMTFVQIFAVAISPKYSNVFLLAIFSICIGLWTLCYYDVMTVFAIPLYKVSLMEHMALFIAPVPILGYMYGHVKEIGKKGMMLVYKILFSIQFVLTVGAIALHTMDIVHGPQMLTYFQLLVIVHLAFLMYILYLGTKNNAKLSRYVVLGLLLVGVCVFYELLTYAATRYTHYQVVQLKGISSVGFTIFIGILVLDLYHRMTKSMMEEKEKELLIKRAYTDDLTQLNNRAYCSDYMRKLSVNENSKYTIINFDLNGLKKMNDTYGHIKGDELICYAAIVLEKAFADEGVVGRMGGDEFIAIIENDNVEFIENLIDKFKNNIKEVNEKKPDLGLSISYGYATNTELNGASSEKVYQVADERMYAYKQETKKAMQG